MSLVTPVFTLWKAMLQAHFLWHRESSLSSDDADGIPLQSALPLLLALPSFSFCQSFKEYGR